MKGQMGQLSNELSMAMKEMERMQSSLLDAKKRVSKVEWDKSQLLAQNECCREHLAQQEKAHQQLSAVLDRNKEEFEAELK